MLFECGSNQMHINFPFKHTPNFHTQLIILIYFPFKQLRLISYSSADSFIKRDYVLDVIDKNSKFHEHYHHVNADLSSYNYIHLTSVASLKAYSMSKAESSCGSKRFLVQHRREYYNDFEDCLRDYKNQNIKTSQKSSRIHHSDGDNGESDSEYVDCTDNSCELRQQSSLSSKSMPHVPTVDYQHNDGFRREISNACCNPVVATTRMIIDTQCSCDTAQAIKSDEVAQLSKNYDKRSQVAAHSVNNNNKRINNNNTSCNSVSSNSTSKNNQNNQLVDKKGTRVVVNEKSISIDEQRPSTSTVPISDDKKVSKKPPVVSSSHQLPQLVDTSTIEVRVVTKQPASSIDDDVKATVNVKKDDAKRKSCKKRQGSIRDPAQR